MELKHYTTIFIIAFMLFFIISLIIDLKKTYTYENIPSKLMTRENGEQYILVMTFSWQFNKQKKIRELFRQNSVYTKNDFNYVIISCLKDQKTSLITRDFEFGVKPIGQSKSTDIKYFIYITGRDNLTVNLKNTINYNEVCSEICKSNIDNNDKEQLIKYFNSLSNNVAFDKENTDAFLELLRKYEPVFSFASSIIGIISALLSI